VTVAGALSDAQRDFLELLVTRRALKFGDFTLKSGRKSPYFINTGCFHQGGDLARLGRAYAATIRARFGDGIQVVFGPAYKGIPLALAAAQEYERQLGRPVGWTYDRKEAKDHGDGGLFVGAALVPGIRVVIVDDVLTAGTALRESLAKLKPTGVEVRGAVVAVDRQEKGAGQRTAIEEIAAELGVEVAPIIRIGDAVEHLAANPVDGRQVLAADDRDRIRDHLAQHAGAG
jgi:orotate phosphoribosyltransferase